MLEWMSDGDATALTLRETAERLGVRPQRVSQLLGDGELEGPQYTGRQRAPKNAKRVWVWSLEELEAQRSRAARRLGSADLSEVPPPLQPVAPDQGASDVSSTAQPLMEALIHRESAARQAAMALKVEGDRLRDELRYQQERVAALEAEVASLRAQLVTSEGARYLRRGTDPTVRA